MSTHAPATPAEAARDTDAALARLEQTVGRLQDADLHRAHRDGGWTVAQVVAAFGRG